VFSRKEMGMEGLFLAKIYMDGIEGSVDGSSSC
jgi:hypothetical protein